MNIIFGDISKFDKNHIYSTTVGSIEYKSLVGNIWGGKIIGVFDVKPDPNLGYKYESISLGKNLPTLYLYYQSH